MALMLNKTRVFRSTMPGDDTIIESVLRYPSSDEESAFLAARSEVSTKDERISPDESNVKARAELYDILVVDIKGKYIEGDVEKDFSYDNPPPPEWLAELCQIQGRKMSDKTKGWQLKDAIPDMYKHFCIMVLVENLKRVDEKTKKK